jgi:hypothetical protein
MFRQGKLRQQNAAAIAPVLLLAEGFAVGALILGGVHLVGTHQDLIQGAVVLVTAVVGALLDGALDALVGMTIHYKSLL